MAMDLDWDCFTGKPIPVKSQGQAKEEQCYCVSAKRNELSFFYCYFAALSWCWLRVLSRPAGIGSKNTTVHLLYTFYINNATYRNRVAVRSRSEEISETEKDREP